jgi:acetyltransferase EpsM
VDCAHPYLCNNANPNSVIGENVIVNTSASVDHECVIEAGVHIRPGAHLGGRVKVGRGTWLGIGDVVKDRVEIGSHSIVGAGAVLLQNLPDGVVAYGVPATIKRKIADTAEV